MKGINYLFENKDFLNSRSIILLLITSCTIHFLLIFQDVNLLYSEIYHETTSSFRYDFLNVLIPSLVDIKGLLQYIGIPIHLTTPVLASLYLTCLVLIIVDYRPILVSAISIYIYAIFVYSALLHSFGVDSYIGVALFINFLVQISRRYHTKIIYPYTIRFLQIQLCIIYFFAGFGKLLGTTWLDGNAMWFIANIYIGSESFLTQSLLEVPYLALILSWGILFIETCYPFIIHNKYTKTMALTSVIAMHIGIILFMQLYSFGIIMSALNLAAYGHYYKPFFRKLENKLDAIKTLVSPRSLYS